MEASSSSQAMMFGFYDFGPCSIWLPAIVA
jgi:hypothetical protein